MQKQSNKKWFINQLLDAVEKIGFKKLDLSHPARSLLISLAKYADKNGYCWPLQKQLENDSGVLTNHQVRYLKILKERKFLTIKRQYDRRNRMTRNFYTINLNAILTISMGVEGDLRVDAIEVQKDCTDIEPNTKEVFDRNTKEVFATIKTIHTTKLPTKTDLDIVQTDRLDDKNTGNISQFTDDFYFEEFWSVYPRKEKKKEARKIWVRERLDSQTAKIILDVRERLARHDRWEDKTFIPMPTTYLNGEIWNDEITDRRKLDVGTKTNNGSIRSNKTSEGILRGFDEYEAAERKRRGIS